MDSRGNSIDAAYLNALRLGPQRIGRASVGSTGIPLPVARRLAATGRPSSWVMRCDLSRRRLVRVRQQIKIIGYLFGFIAPEIATELAVQLRRFAR